MLARDGLTIRAALLLAFGLLLGIWLFAGYFLARRMSDLQRDAEAINVRYIRTQELLGTIRTQILLGSVYVRDALLDPVPGTTAEYHKQFEQTYAVIEDALQHYDPIIDSSVELQQVGRLGDEIHQFRMAMLQVLASDKRTWPTEARALLRGQIVPRRDNVIRVSEELQGLNRSAFVRQQAATAAIYRLMQRRLWVQLGLALAASFAIGLIAVRHVTRLEQRLQGQHQLEAQYSRELQRLSTRLVTAQEEERRTIARELHDEVGQVLTALKVELAVAQRGIEAADGPSQLLTTARTIADGALKTVRDLSRLLHPAILDDLGLPAALQTLVREVSARHGLDGDLLQDPSSPRLSPAIEAAIYRIAQEALTNVIRHSDASKFRIVVRQTADTVTITVEDDGKGFDPAPREEGGLGLLGIRERASQLNGTMRVESAPGTGTRMSVELPVRLRSGGEDGGALAAPSGTDTTSV